MLSDLFGKNAHIYPGPFRVNTQPGPIFDSHIPVNKKMVQ